VRLHLIAADTEFTSWETQFIAKNASDYCTSKQTPAEAVSLSHQAGWCTAVCDSGAGQPSSRISSGDRPSACRVAAIAAAIVQPTTLQPTSSTAPRGCSAATAWDQHRTCQDCWNRQYANSWLSAHTHEWTSWSCIVLSMVTPHCLPSTGDPSCAGINTTQTACKFSYSGACTGMKSRACAYSAARSSRVASGTRGPPPSTRPYAGSGSRAPSSATPPPASPRSVCTSHAGCDETGAGAAS